MLIIYLKFRLQILLISEGKLINLPDEGVSQTIKKRKSLKIQVLSRFAFSTRYLQACELAEILIRNSNFIIKLLFPEESLFDLFSS